ncbi:hypothetical protein B0H15DRAFT_955208 [Mycena belliarum]|uniref:Uncharacterized protein n=1 Tax=Mycena belliarum TaxID=1033014 RepID=A0AAD6XNL5_9AGAR|nr:hypothetical protein B0H15DRAFT_955208 [Mycena belliae]
MAHCALQGLKYQVDDGVAPHTSLKICSTARDAAPDLRALLAPGSEPRPERERASLQVYADPVPHSAPPASRSTQKRHGWAHRNSAATSDMPTSFQVRAALSQDARAIFEHRSQFCIQTMYVRRVNGRGGAPRREPLAWLPATWGWDVSFETSVALAISFPGKRPNVYQFGLTPVNLTVPDISTRNPECRSQKMTA